MPEPSAATRCGGTRAISSSSSIVNRGQLREYAQHAPQAWQGEASGKSGKRGLRAAAGRGSRRGEGETTAAGTTFPSTTRTRAMSARGKGRPMTESGALSFRDAGELEGVDQPLGPARSAVRSEERRWG